MQNMSIRSVLSVVLRMSTFLGPYGAKLIHQNPCSRILAAIPVHAWPHSDLWKGWEREVVKWLRSVTKKIPSLTFLDKKEIPAVFGVSVR